MDLGKNERQATAKGSRQWVPEGRDLVNAGMGGAGKGGAKTDPADKTRSVGRFSVGAGQRMCGAGLPCTVNTARPPAGKVEFRRWGQVVLGLDLDQGQIHSNCRKLCATRRSGERWGRRSGF